MHSHLFCFFLFLLYASCQSPQQDPSSEQLPQVARGDSIEVTDDLGRSVKLQQPTGRIIPIAPSITEMLYFSGAGSHVIAVSQADDYPPAIDTLPRFNSFPMDYETIVRLDPDVIIGTDQINNPRDAHLFESLGIPVLYFSFDSWSDIPRTIRYFGKITSNSESAQEAADSLQRRVDTLQEAIPAAERRPQVLFLIGSDQLFAFGKDSYIHELIRTAGGISITESLESPSPVLNEEFVITSEPEIIIGTFEEANDLLENHPSFQSVPAVLNDRICTVAPSIVLRPGPRLVEGMLEMAQCIHPDLSLADEIAQADS